MTIALHASLLLVHGFIRSSTKYVLAEVRSGTDLTIVLTLPATKVILYAIALSVPPPEKNLQPALSSEC